MKKDFSSEYIESFEYYINKAKLLTERSEVDIKANVDGGAQQIQVVYNNKNLDFQVLNTQKQPVQDKNIDRMISTALSTGYVINTKAPYETESTYVKIPVADIQKTLFSNLTKKIPTLKLLTIQNAKQNTILVSNFSVELSLSKVFLDEKNAIASMEFVYSQPTK